MIPAGDASPDPLIAEASGDQDPRARNATTADYAFEVTNELSESPENSGRFNDDGSASYAEKDHRDPTAEMRTGPVCPADGS